MTVADDVVKLHPEEETTYFHVYNLGMHALAFGIAVAVLDAAALETRA